MVRGRPAGLSRPLRTFLRRGTVLALLWLTTTAVAWRRIVRRDIRGHRAWMVRSFALSFAAVTLRLALPGLMAAGLDLNVAYPMVAWLCWVPNLAAAEVGLARVRRQATTTRPPAEGPVATAAGTP